MIMALEEVTLDLHPPKPKTNMGNGEPLSMRGLFILILSPLILKLPCLLVILKVCYLSIIIRNFYFL